MKQPEWVRQFTNRMKFQRKGGVGGGMKGEEDVRAAECGCVNLYYDILCILD